MREKLIELIRQAQDCGCDVTYVVEMNYVENDAIADHLIANGVTIPVRCKDCKHYDNSEGIQWCHLNSKFAQWGTDWHSFPEDGFCSYGERRTDE